MRPRSLADGRAVFSREEGATKEGGPVIRGVNLFYVRSGEPVAAEGRGPSKVGSWFRDWQRPLRQFLARRRAGCAADIDDIAQEMFLRVLRYDRSDLIDYPQAYLFKIASNVSAEWAMRSNRRMPHPILNMSSANAMLL